MEQHNEQNKMLRQALSRMNKHELSPDFKAQLMAQVRQKEHRREMWIGVGLTALFILSVCALSYVAYRIFLHTRWIEIFTPENIYRLKLWSSISITAFFFAIVDYVASPKILAFFDKIDPKK